MLPHPSMAFAWDEDVIRPTRVLVAIFLLTFIVLVGASGLTAFTMHDSPATVATQRVSHPPINAVAR